LGLSDSRSAALRSIVDDGNRQIFSTELRHARQNGEQRALSVLHSLNLEIVVINFKDAIQRRYRSGSHVKKLLSYFQADNARSRRSLSSRGVLAVLPER